ncbi:lamin-L(I) [Lingula anatina]|uniref:Lamin-L(I) n=1 Tax=Lingula anatina TaxID=7574 RepID=A0A1S3JAE0_LINAN|nr:lamin-L(I) [Lingula anatina]|eukprot:XP_013406849.1 lamin-L(I) [Lingula anatina]
MSGLIIENNSTTRTYNQELQNIHDRFSNYVQMVRSIRDQSSQVESTAFLTSVQVLEKEVVKLKNMYEYELEKLRRRLDDVNHEKSHYQAQIVKTENLVSQLQNQLHQETDKSNGLFDQLNVLHRTIAQKEHDFQRTLEQLQMDYTNVLRENQDLKKRCEQETINRQEVEHRNRTLQNKMDFQQHVSAQEMKDIRVRLDSSANTILHLESKVKETVMTNNNLVEMLQRVRETAQAELDRYKIESEENFSRSASALKAHVEIDRRNLEAMSAENTKLRSEVDLLAVKIRTLREQMASLETEKKNMGEILEQERQRSAHHVQRLEMKLQEVNDFLFQKMKEVNAAKDAQIPLKAEIETFKTLLEEEERRLKLQMNMENSKITLPPVISTAPISRDLKAPQLIYTPHPPNNTSRQRITTNATSSQMVKASGDLWVSPEMKATGVTEGGSNNAQIAPKTGNKKSKKVSTTHTDVECTRCRKCRAPLQKFDGGSKVVCSNCFTCVHYMCGKALGGNDHFENLEGSQAEL